MAHLALCQTAGDVRLVDLGKWLNEEHLVSEPLRPEDMEDAGDSPAAEGDESPSRA